MAYDGDTIYIEMPGLPPELAEMSVRMLGIDAPERGGRADCIGEMLAGQRARARLEALLRAADAVLFCDVEWDKYGGRVLAHVIVDGADLAAVMIADGLARPYDGGARQPWCGNAALPGGL